MGAQAAAAIRDAIVFGALPPGAPLALDRVAASLEMSVSPVRDAVRELVNLGLVEVVPYRRARVTELDLDEMREIYELRSAVEEICVAWAAQRITSEQELGLRRVLDRIERANRSGDLRAAVIGNTTFHAKVAAASGSAWGLRVLIPLLETTQRYSAAVWRSQRRGASVDIETAGHREILEACVRHDACAAVAALREHLTLFRREFTWALSGANSAPPEEQGPPCA